MQIANFRYFSLTLVLFAATGLYTALGAPLGAGIPRWPTSDADYAVDGWLIGPEKMEQTGQTNIVSRMFRNTRGVTATLTIVTNQAPKLYGAGAEVPFLGNGFVVEPAAIAPIQPQAQGVSGLLAQRGADRWLVMYAYGERRGLLGNGAVPWMLALIDAMFARPNDYYKLYLMAEAKVASQARDKDVVELAASVFPKIASWYTT